MQNTLEFSEDLSMDERRLRAIDLVKKVVAAGRLQSSDEKTVHAILDHLSHDAEIKMRQAFAEAVASYPLLPRAIAERLALDAATVASPVLERSTVLDDEFLIDLLRSQVLCTPRQSAIARRDEVSEILSQALIDTKDEVTVDALLQNDGAKISALSLLQSFDDHRGSDVVPLSLASRANLPGSIVRDCHTALLSHTIEGRIADDMRARLIETHALPKELADDIIREARERVSSAHGSQQDAAHLEGFVSFLHARNELTASLMLRSLCGGDLAFFEHGLAHLAGESLERVENIVRGAGETAFRDLYFQSGLPTFMRRAFTVAVDIISRNALDGYPKDRKTCLDEIVRQITRFYRNISPGQMDDVLAQLGREMDRRNPKN